MTMMVTAPKLGSRQKTNRPNSIVYRESNERKILEFLRTHDQFDYTMAEIAKCLGFKYVATVKNTMKRLSKKGKIARVRMILTNNWTWQLIDWLDDAKHDELNRRW